MGRKSREKENGRETEREGQNSAAWASPFTLPRGFNVTNVPVRALFCLGQGVRWMENSHWRVNCP